MQNKKACRSDMNVFVRCAVVVFIFASIVASAKALMKYNDYRERIEALELKRNEYAEEIENIEYELDQKFDDEYVEKIAKEKLNLCNPNEIIYYNGLN